MMLHLIVFYFRFTTYITSNWSINILSYSTIISVNDNIAVASTPKNQVDNKYAPIILSHISKVRKAVTSIDNVNP